MTAQPIVKLLTGAGIGSRRQITAIIKRGGVAVNGELVQSFNQPVDPVKDVITIDGRPVSATAEPLVYLMLNKPFGYICSLDDPEGRPIAYDLLKAVKQRVYSVGRLDFDSLGLLLFTDDGEWAHRLTHPRYHVPKTYKLTVDGKLSEEALNALGKGIQLDDGSSGPSKINLVQEKGGKSTLRITVTRGRSRLVRRMMEAVDHRVVHLIRTGFGVIELGDLKIGHYRHLETDEVEAMKKMVGL